MLHVTIQPKHVMGKAAANLGLAREKNRKEYATYAVALYVGGRCVKHCPPPLMGPDGPLLTESAIWVSYAGLETSLGPRATAQPPDDHRNADAL